MEAFVLLLDDEHDLQGITPRPLSTSAPTVLTTQPAEPSFQSAHVREERADQRRLDPGHRALEFRAPP